ncbi:hypothetical protein BS47DRAFT_1382887 [Hydnum rufescens UP504]|uniref:Uncharacterized protein n=1 Tax=Hydnum rufescens UP504 TaxID=1448309 RepID=A0A9P6AVN5_9AGAM|nr:hypothetical protein BS47DRAFT_1382887 [Hydnum rufescens UP504]
MLAACLHVLAFSAVLTQVAHATPQPLAVGSQDSSIDYYPPGAWGYANATDGFSKVDGAGVLMFVFQNASDAEVSWRTPNATETFEFWAFQRSDGGNASISFDNGPETVFDYYNSSGRGTDGPVLVYSTGNLSPAEHTVRIKNLFDVRGTLNRGYGQLNVDHFVIIPLSADVTSSSTSSAAPSSTSSPARTSSTQSSSPTAKPGGSSNHTGAIAGGVAGGVVGLAVISLALFLFLRKRRRPGYTAPPMTENPGYPGSDTTGLTPEYWNTTSPAQRFSTADCNIIRSK